MNYDLNFLLNYQHFRNESKESLLEVIEILRKETLSLKQIKSNQLNELYFKIDKLNGEIYELNKQIQQFKDNSVGMNKIIESITQPLTIKERLSGKFDIKKINKKKD